MKKSFMNDINEINASIEEVEKLLKESMNFCEDDSFDDNEMDDESMANDEEPLIGDEPIDDEVEVPAEDNRSIDSYVDHIRKYALNGLSALCENPESEEYQMLKKIFQMCDKKPEKKDGISESHRLFGVMKDNKKVIFETIVKDNKDFKLLKDTLISEAISKGYNPKNIRLVSEMKIIK